MPEYHRVPSAHIKQAMRALDCESGFANWMRIRELCREIWFAASLRSDPFVGEKRPCEQCHVISKRVFAASSDLAGLLGRWAGNRARLVSHALASRGELRLAVYTASSGAVACQRSAGLSGTPFDAEGRPFGKVRIGLTGKGAGAFSRCRTLHRVMP